MIDAFKEKERYQLFKSRETSDRKPPDKRKQNAGPVASGTGVEKKSLGKRLQTKKTSRNWLNHQPIHQELDTFERQSKTSVTAKLRRSVEAAYGGKDDQRPIYRETSTWQSIGRVVDRILEKGARV